MTPSATRAITILEQLEASCSSSSLAYWATPNIILTLSGARAYCDGVFWDDDRSVLEGWDQEIKASLTSIQRAVSITASTTGVQIVRDDETYASLELLTTEGIEYILSRTSLLGDNPMGITEVTGSEPSILSVIEQLIARLRIQDLTKDFNDDNLRHTAFGILVGYPDKAILGTARPWDNDDPFIEPLVDADIRGAGYYLCPQPTYAYPRHLFNDPTINTHEQLWSKILADYYSSSFHRRLERDKSFIRKMKELKSFR